MPKECRPTGSTGSRGARRAGSPWFSRARCCTTPTGRSRPWRTGRPAFRAATSASSCPTSCGAAEWWDPCRSCKLALEGDGRADRETWAERWKRRGAAVVGALMVALAAMVPLMFLLGAVYVVIDLTAGIWRSL